MHRNSNVRAMTSMLHGDSITTNKIIRKVISVIYCHNVKFHGE